MVFRDVTLLGYDLITAMKMSVDRAASVWLTEFFQGMVGTLTAGGQLKLYFLNRAEHYMRENRSSTINTHFHRSNQVISKQGNVTIDKRCVICNVAINVFVHRKGSENFCWRSVCCRHRSG